MKNSLFLFIFLTSSIISSGQNEATGNNGIKANNISLGLAGSTYPIGLSFSQMFTDKLSFDISAGLLSVGGGFTFYLTNPRYHRLNPYVGFYGGIITDNLDDELYDFSMFYVPVGISYFGKKNFQ